MGGQYTQLRKSYVTSVKISTNCARGSEEEQASRYNCSHEHEYKALDAL